MEDEKVCESASSGFDPSYYAYQIGMMNHFLESAAKAVEELKRKHSWIDAAQAFELYFKAVTK